MRTYAMLRQVNITRATATSPVRHTDYPSAQESAVTFASTTCEAHPGSTASPSDVQIQGELIAAPATSATKPAPGAQVHGELIAAPASATTQPAPDAAPAIELGIALPVSPGPKSDRRASSSPALRISDLAATKSQDESKILKDRRIPWWIIDPTGDIIHEQRRIRTQEHHSARTAELKTDRERNEYKRHRNSPMGRLLRAENLPTLYPAWDVVTAVALIYTALVTPFEVGYLPPPERADEGLFLLNRLVDVIFIFDMLFAFFTMVEVDTTSASGSDVTWEMRLGKIARVYLSTWFVIDTMSVATSLFDILPMLGVGDSLGSAKIVRIVRALRLIKLVRLAKSSKSIKQLESTISISTFTRTILRLLFKLLLTVHYYACILRIVASFPATPLDTWMGTYGYCQPDPANANTTKPLVDPICVDPAYLYLQCIRWSMGLIAGAGFPMFPARGPYPPFYAEDRWGCAWPRFDPGTASAAPLLPLAASSCC